jgi:hypothetical protein
MIATVFRAPAVIVVVVAVFAAGACSRAEGERPFAYAGRVRFGDGAQSCAWPSPHRTCRRHAA